MHICRTIADLRAATAGATNIGLVTSRGGLHGGHLALITAAQAQNDCVVVALFVIPPTRGGPRDLDMSVRDESRDLATLKTAGVTVAFIPDEGEIYPDGDETTVKTTRLATILSGAQRPGHFRALTTFYMRLFNITGARAAYFGEKDYQMLQIIRRMVRDLHMPLSLHSVPTVRDGDGLALSSRNLSLGEDDRAAAVCLSKALDAAQDLADFRLPIDRIDQIVRSTINREPRARLRAVDIVQPDTLDPATGLLTGPVVIMVSAEFSGLLLIDQRDIAPGAP